MPRDPTKRRIEAHLDPMEYDLFHEIALQKDWSDKKLAEKIIQWWLYDKGLIEKPKGERP